LDVQAGSLIFVEQIGDDEGMPVRYCCVKHLVDWWVMSVVETLGEESSCFLISLEEKNRCSRTKSPVSQAMMSSSSIGVGLGRCTGSAFIGRSSSEIGVDSMKPYSVGVTSGWTAV